MAKLHSSGKDTDPKVPYQKEKQGARVIRNPNLEPIGPLPHGWFRKAPEPAGYRYELRKDGKTVRELTREEYESILQDCGRPEESD